ncbi:MAG: hypothetical protein JNJ58_13610 [Chitinophagaceae bacterium]|nr:hypothetical protein [Chitinophagaceae bacterium]
MQAANDIQQELKDLGCEIPLVGMPAFQVPEHYFQELPELLMEQIHREDFLAGLPKQTPFTLPDGYFDQMADQVKADIALEAFVDQLPKSNPYTLPQGYFDTLLPSVQQKISPAPVLTYTSKRRWTTTLSLAASLLLFISIGFGLLLQPGKPAMNVEQELSSLTSSEIDAYIQSHQSEFDTDLALLEMDDSKIDIPKLESEIIESQLNRLSDEEINAYTL